MLSFALLAVAGGSICAMLTAGSWIARVGTRPACLAGGIAMATCCALILVAPYYWLLLVVLAVFGSGMATLDVAMNAEASAVEQALGRPIMSSLHGMFSVGGMAGAAAGGALLAHGMAPAVHLALASAASAAVLLVSHARGAAARAACRGASRRHRRRTGGARPALWALGGVALVALIAEGAMYDWATVYMRDVVLATPALVERGLRGVHRRHGGGAFRRRRRARPLRRAATGDLAARRWPSSGWSCALLLPNAFVAMTGFTLMGLGLANMMPVLFAAAAHVKGMTRPKDSRRWRGWPISGCCSGR